MLGQDQLWPWESTAVHTLSGLAGEDGKKGVGMAKNATMHQDEVGQGPSSIRLLLHSP